MLLKEDLGMNFKGAEFTDKPLKMYFFIDTLSIGFKMNNIGKK